VLRCTRRAATWSVEQSDRTRDVAVMHTSLLRRVLCSACSLAPGLAWTFCFGTSFSARIAIDGDEFNSNTAGSVPNVMSSSARSAN
jgi:hypothetical protein